MAWVPTIAMGFVLAVSLVALAGSESSATAAHADFSCGLALPTSDQSVFAYISGVRISSRAWPRRVAWSGPRRTSPPVQRGHGIELVSIERLLRSPSAHPRPNGSPPPVVSRTGCSATAPTCATCGAPRCGECAPRCRTGRGRRDRHAAGRKDAGFRDVANREQLASHRLV